MSARNSVLARRVHADRSPDRVADAHPGSRIAIRWSCPRPRLTAPRVGDRVLDARGSRASVAGHVVQGRGDLLGQHERLGRQPGPSCPAVRAPTIGAATPGRSRTQASATSSGESRAPRPPCRRPRRCAAARSSGSGSTNVRTRTPRHVSPPGCPSGTSRSARPGRAATRRGCPSRAPRAAGTTSRSIAALQQRVLHLVDDQRRPTRRPQLPGRAACAVCQPPKLDTPT